MSAFVFRPQDYPEVPGCYIMRDNAGRVLYIGKSVNLRSRLRSYFRQPQHNSRFRDLVRNTASIEVILVSNETESLTLENHLIKMHRPPFNRALKRDDSGYGELVLTNEPYPMLRVSFRDRRGGRGADDADAAACFGPAGEWCLKTLAEFLSNCFRLRTCDPMPDEVCFRWHLGRCGGVCAGKQAREDYAMQARQAALMLEDGGGRLTGLLRAEMERSAERLDYERAAELLRLIRALERETDEQVVDLKTGHDQDVLYCGADGMLIARIKRGMLSAMEFRVLDCIGGGTAGGRDLVERGGDVGTVPLGSDNLSGVDCGVGEALSAADDRCNVNRDAGSGSAVSVPDQQIVEYYAGSAAAIPDEVIVNRIGDARKTAELLRRLKGAPVRVTVPKRGAKRALLQLCERNYEFRREAAAASERDGIGGIWI